MGPIGDLGEKEDNVVSALVKASPAESAEEHDQDGVDDSMAEEIQDQPDNIALDSTGGGIVW